MDPKFTQPFIKILFSILIPIKKYSNSYSTSRSSSSEFTCNGRVTNQQTNWTPKRVPRPVYIKTAAPKFLVFRKKAKKKCFHGDDGVIKNRCSKTVVRESLLGVP